VRRARKSSTKQIKLWGTLGRRGNVEYGEKFCSSIYAAFAAQAKVVGPAQQLLGSPVEHYHHKLIMKERFDEELTTGTWEWVRRYSYRRCVPQSSCASLIILLLRFLCETPVLVAKP
jgi:hypothetical protein